MASVTDKQRRPAFQFYAADDLLANGAVMEMGHEALGVHMRLYCRSWLEGPIPFDPARIARSLNMREKKFSTLWQEVSPAWELVEGRIVCPTLEAKRERAEAYSASRSENGRRGGRPSEKHMLSETKAKKSSPSPSPPSSPEGTSTPTPTTVATSARVPDGGWGLADEEVLARSEWGDLPMPTRRQLLPAVRARRTAPDPSVTVWGAIKYVLFQPLPGTEHAAANGKGKATTTPPPLPPELTAVWLQFIDLPPPERERWMERGRRKAPGNLVGEDLERTQMVYALREYQAAELAA